MHSGLREPVLFALSVMGWVGAGATCFGLAMGAECALGRERRRPQGCYYAGVSVAIRRLRRLRKLAHSFRKWSPLRLNTLCSPLIHGSLLEYKKGICILPRRSYRTTVQYGPIEIDSREAVSRFLYVHGKSGRQ